MRATVMSVLLYLLSAVVEVHSQTVPYVSFMGTNLTNHSYVNLTIVGRDEDDNEITENFKCSYIALYGIKDDKMSVATTYRGHCRQ